MSLLLRRDCQESLDNAGLHNIHTRIDDASKCLTLVGECGQRLALISGIAFNRATPNAAEIAYAVKLLDVFLVKHRDIIKNLLIAKKELAATPQVKINNWENNIKITQYGYPPSIKSATISYENFHFVLNSDSLNGNNVMWDERKPGELLLDEIFYLDRSHAPNDESICWINIRDFQKIQVPAKLLKEAHDKMILAMAYRAAEQKAEDFQSQLNSCEI